MIIRAITAAFFNMVVFIVTPEVRNGRIRANALTDLDREPGLTRERRRDEVHHGAQGGRHRELLEAHTFTPTTCPTFPLPVPRRLGPSSPRAALAGPPRVAPRRRVRLSSR